MLRGLLVVACILLLCGCQQTHKIKQKYWRTQEKEYLKSTLNTPLNVPSELSFQQDYETYPIPESLPDPSSLKPVPIVPPGFGKLETRNS